MNIHETTHRCVHCGNFAKFLNYVFFGELKLEKYECCSCCKVFYLAKYR